MASLKSYALAVAGGLVVAGILGLAWRTHGAAQYKAGYAQAQAEAETKRLQMQEAMQYERDRADAEHRGAVLAREAVQRDLVAVRGELDRVLRAHGRDPENPRARSGSDGAGPDWISGFGACYGEYAELAGNAAKWADQVNGLQGYVKAIRSKNPG